MGAVATSGGSDGGGGGTGGGETASFGCVGWAWGSLGRLWAVLDHRGFAVGGGGQRRAGSAGVRAVLGAALGVVAARALLGQVWVSMGVWAVFAWVKAVHGHIRVPLCRALTMLVVSEVVETVACGWLPWATGVLFGVLAPAWWLLAPEGEGVQGAAPEEARAAKRGRLSEALQRGVAAVAAMPEHVALGLQVDHF